MKKIFIVISVLVLLILTGCERHKVSKNFTTEYGDELIITAKEHETLQDNCIDYEIVGSDLEGGFSYYDTNTFVLPEYPENEIVGILDLENVHLYAFREYIFYVYAKKINSLPKNYDISLYLANKDFKDQAKKETFLTIIHALMKTKKFKYVSQYASILVYEKNADTIEIVQNWATGRFTEDEIEINAQDGYTTLDLQQWAIELLQNEN